MVEKDMQKIFKTHLDKNPIKATELYELKICKMNAMPFSSVQEHQIAALLQAHNGNLYHKIQDNPVSWGQGTFMRFTKKKPFDCLVLAHVASFVVIWYYRPREKKYFIKVPIEAFILEMKNSTRKSLTEARAREIGEVVEIST